MADEQKTNLRLEIAHVLFIDIVGYSKLSTDEQSETLHELNAIVRRTETAQAAQAAGQLVFLPTGDGMALVFTGSEEEPVECALEIAQALRVKPSLPVRMGIHSGPVHHVADVNQRENIAGAGINIAQRIMDCGDAGHILVSKRVADDLAQSRRWQPYLHDLGDVEVKHGQVVSLVNFYADVIGNPEPPSKIKQAKTDISFATAPAKRSRILVPLLIGGFLLFAVAVLAIIFAPAILKETRSRSAPSSSPAPPSATIPEKSIAVLPFENLSDDKSNAYFANGIQDEILTRLSKIADLNVISRTSTQSYKSAPANLPEIAQQLGVAHILEGSVQKSDDAVRINVQLIKAANDSHLWADTFDRKLTDIFSVETEVAKAIADQLRAKLTGQEELIIAAKPTDNTEAYDAYLRGLAYSLKTVNVTATALEAQKYLRESVQLDPRFALAWGLLSYVDARGYSQLTLQPTTALREEARQAADTALTIQPNLGEAVLARGYYYYYCLKDSDTAVGYFEQARHLLPNNSRIPESLGLVARRRGQWDRSEANDLLIGDLALVNMGLGDKAAALALSDQAMALTSIEKDAVDGADPTEILARVAGRMGEPDRAIAALQKLLAVPYAGPLVANLPLTPALLRLDPMFDPLRNDPRFQKLCEDKPR